MRTDQGGGAQFATESGDEQKVVLYTPAGDSAMDETLDAAHVVSLAEAIIDSGNSTTATLGGGAVFTGTSIDVTNYSAATIQVFADQASAANGLSLQTSTDDSNWDHAHTYDILASTAKHVDLTLDAQYFRVVYTNGASVQGAFRLQTKLHKNPPSQHTHEIDFVLTGDHPAAVTKSVITGADAVSGDYVNISTYGVAGFNFLPVILGDASANLVEIVVTQSDNIANTTNGIAVSSFQYVFDGSTWDRAPGNSTDGTLVNLGTNNDIQGDVAHDSADSGNPLKIGGKARTTNPTAVGDGDRVDSFFDDHGKQVIILNTVRDLLAHNTVTISDTTETTILAAGAAGVFHDLIFLSITNTSNKSTRVDIRDDTAGTIRMSFAIAAKGGIIENFPSPFPQAVAADNWTAQAADTVTDLRINVMAQKVV